MNNKKHICKNCKYSEDIGDKFECNCPKFIYTGQCEEVNKEKNTDCLGYWDCESYGAGFEVGANFGCIHWEKKEDKS